MEKSRMRSEPLYYEGREPGRRADRESRRPPPIALAPDCCTRRAGRWCRRFSSFSASTFIVLTSNLLLPGCDWAKQFHASHDRSIGGRQARMVANKLPLLRRYDRAPMIQRVLSKAACSTSESQIGFCDEFYHRADRVLDGSTPRLYRRAETKARCHDPR